MKISESLRVIGRGSLAATLLLLSHATWAQVVPSVDIPAKLSAFGTYTHGYSDWGEDRIYGFTIGGDLETRRHWGLEARGSLLRWGAESAQAWALFGPRAALHFGRFTPYGAFLAGLGHARWQSGPDTSYDRAGSGGQWMVLGGADLALKGRLSIRLGEISYSKIYVLQHGLTPTDYSAGLVFRLR